MSVTVEDDAALRALRLLPISFDAAIDQRDACDAVLLAFQHERFGLGVRKRT